MGPNCNDAGKVDHLEDFAVEFDGHRPGLQHFGNIESLALFFS
jgi:hypothetical protein